MSIDSRDTREHPALSVPILDQRSADEIHVAREVDITPFTLKRGHPRTADVVKMEPRHLIDHLLYSHSSLSRRLASPSMGDFPVCRSSTLSD